MTKKTLLIYFENWGGHFKDMRFWTSRFEGELGVEDYHTKNILIEHAIKNNHPYKILRYHRNGNVSVVFDSTKKNQKGYPYVRISI